MWKLGLVMSGISSLVLMLGGILLRVFKEQLTLWRPTPPIWTRCIVLGLCLVAVCGLVITYFAED